MGRISQYSLDYNSGISWYQASMSQSWLRSVIKIKKKSISGCIKQSSTYCDHDWVPGGRKDVWFIVPLIMFFQFLGKKLSGQLQQKPCTEERMNESMPELQCRAAFLLMVIGLESKIYNTAMSMWWIKSTWLDDPSNGDASLNSKLGKGKKWHDSGP